MLDKLSLSGINLIIGANGSGKSNLLNVFSFLNAIRDGRLQEFVAKAGGAERILHFGSKATEAVYVHMSFQGGVNQYDIRLEPSDNDELLPVSETAYFWDKARFTDAFEEYLSPDGKEAGISRSTTRTPGYVRGHLDRWRTHHFHDTSSGSPMKKTNDLHDNRYLRPDGANLAAFLYGLKQTDPRSLFQIRRAIQRVAPFFDDFVLEPQRINPEKVRLEWRHGGSDAYFDGSSLSDGTLRFIALATLFLQPERLQPSVILVDEPELGLHPAAMTVLSSLIRQVSFSKQVILSTQSSFFLDHFEPEDVLVADRERGQTTFTRLTTNKLERWLREYSLGQLWEKNEFGGRPAGSE